MLHGLPVAHKDLVDTAGIRTTRGSPFYRDNVPTRDALIVTRIRAAGAITIGKTNTPEFGAGSQTFNTVFGATRNPYDVTKTCGGSSGGAAVALACGMVPIADGSDTGGSLRNPAAFCNVVGLRPSPGRVPASRPRGRRSRCRARWREPWPTSRCSSACDRRTGRAQSALDRRRRARFRPRLNATSRACASPGGAGSAGFRSNRDPRVVDANRTVFEDLGCVVEEAEPDFTGVDERFRCATRAITPQYAPLVEQRPEWVKDTIKFEVAQAERPARRMSVARSRGRRGCTTRAVSSSSDTSTSSSRSRRSSRST